MFRRVMIKYCGVTVALIVFFCQAVFAQLTLTGKVIDTNGLSVPYTNIRLYVKTDTINPVDQKVSDKNGHFKFSIDSAGDFSITASNISYIKKSKDIAIVKDTNSLVMVLAEKQFGLDAVDVSSKKVKLMEYKIDRRILNVAGHKSMIGKSAAEIFTSLPGVLMMDNEVKIDGIISAKVMLNNRLVMLSGDELVSFLSGLRSENIEKIEVIPHPPVEYEANGGLINIIYKTPIERGLTGSLSGGWNKGRYNSYNCGANISYMRGKFQMNMNYQRSENNEFFDSWQDRSIYSQNTYAAIDSGTIRKRNDILSTSVTVDVDSNNRLAVDYNHFQNKKGTKISSLIDYYEPKTEDFSHTIGFYPRNEQTMFNNIGFNYIHRLNTTGDNISFLADATWNDERYHNDAQSNFFDKNNHEIRDSIYGNDGYAYSRILTSEIKFEKSLGEQLHLKSGIKYSNSSINSNIDFFNIQDSVTLGNNDLSNKYIYHEQIGAIYLQLDGNIKGYEYQAGARIETTESEGRSLNLNQTNKNRYSNVFPYLYLSKVLNEEKNNYITLGYSSSINRPNYNYLNPFVNFTNDYTSFSGNPFLRPEINHSLELSYYLHDNYYATLEVEKTSKSIMQLPIPNLENGTTNTVWSNIDDAYAYSLSLGIPVEISKWWNSSINITGIYQKIKYQDFENNRPYAFLQTQQQFSIAEKYTIDLNALFVSKLNQGTATIKSFYQIDLGLQRSFLNNKLSVKLLAKDLFNTWKLYSDADFQGMQTKIRARKQTQTIGLQLLYNLNLGKSFKKIKAERSNEDENNRLQVVQ